MFAELTTGAVGAVLGSITTIIAQVYIDRRARRLDEAEAIEREHEADKRQARRRIAITLGEVRQYSRDVRDVGRYLDTYIERRQIGLKYLSDEEYIQHLEEIAQSFRHLARASVTKDAILDLSYDHPDLLEAYNGLARSAEILSAAVSAFIGRWHILPGGRRYRVEDAEETSTVMRAVEASYAKLKRSTMAVAAGLGVEPVECPPIEWVDRLINGRQRR